MVLTLLVKKNITKEENLFVVKIETEINENISLV